MAKDTRIGEVYVLRCLVNGKEYVGQTICGYRNRLRGHIKDARNGCDRPLYAAMRKYGIENFTAEVVWRGPQSELNSTEKDIIRQRNTYSEIGWGYNLTTGGEQCVMSEEARRKIAENSRKLWADERYREKQTYTPERALRISQFATERARNGEYQTLEAREKISNKLRIAWTVPEKRDAWQKAMREAWRLPESRKRASDSAKKRSATPEFRVASSKMQKALWANPEYKARMIEKFRAGKQKKRSGEYYLEPNAKAFQVGTIRA